MRRSADHSTPQEVRLVGSGVAFDDATFRFSRRSGSADISGQPLATTRTLMGQPSVFRDNRLGRQYLNLLLAGRTRNVVRAKTQHGQIPRASQPRKKAVDTKRHPWAYDPGVSATCLTRCGAVHSESTAPSQQRSATSARA